MAYENYFNPVGMPAGAGVQGYNQPIQPVNPYANVNPYQEQFNALQQRLAAMEAQQKQQPIQQLQQLMYGQPPQMPLKDPKVAEFEQSKECEAIYFKHFNKFIQEAGLITQIRPQFESSKYYTQDCYKDMQEAYGQFLNSKKEV